MFKKLNYWLNFNQTKKPSSRRIGLQMDALQDRIVPTAFIDAGGNLVINGGAGNDSVTVSVNYVLPTSRDRSGSDLMVNLNTYRVVENGVTTDFPMNQVSGGKVYFNGYAGNDRFENRTSLVAIAEGGIGNDTLIGGGAGDILSGNSGMDKLVGNGGADRLYADSASSFSDLFANDMRGGDGNDTIVGAEGPDLIDGGYGNDHLSGRGGNDRIYAALGLQEFGSNFLAGEIGNDKLYGSDGPDVVHGGIGDDLITGAGGNDQLFGNDGTDTLMGNAGNDTLDGGNSVYGDKLYGGIGYDTAVVIAGKAQTFECESVRVTSVPTDSPQDDSWSCGPNSAYRFLKAYGYNVTYSQMRSLAQEQGIVSNFGLGTTSDTMLEVLQEFRPYTKQVKDTTTSRMIDLLLEGKPVIALVSLGKQFIGVGSVAKMHYVVMTGYDKATDTFFYTNTNGAQESWTRAQFEDNWDWHDDFTYGGEAGQALLRSMGMKNRTLFY